MNELNDFLEKIPNDLVKLKGNKLEMKEDSKLPVLESYIDKEKADFISINRDLHKITFTFETDGSLSAKDALKETINILIKKYDELGKLLKNIK